ncbi:MAG: GTPase Era [Dongiaceae bacterium]
MDENITTKYSTIAIIGLPNAGKSTLVNALCRAKVAIVTPKPQTTRFRVSGIYVEDQTQLVFIDTPGIFKGKHTLDKAMVGAAWQAADDADQLILVIDVSRLDLESHEDLWQTLRAINKPVYLVLNKIDLIDLGDLLPLAGKLSQQYDFAKVFMISAKRDDGIKDIRKHLLGEAKQGPWHFAGDDLSDISARLLAAEFTREQLFLKLEQEIPYGLTVETESFEEFENGSVKITQSILIERESHRPIILGKGGNMIKNIRLGAQQQMQATLNRAVHLFLHVKVRENWKEDPAYYREHGLKFPQ